MLLLDVFLIPVLNDDSNSKTNRQVNDFGRRKSSDNVFHSPSPHIMGYVLHKMHPQLIHGSKAQGLLPEGGP
jgi:hypothetical protein